MFQVTLRLLSLSILFLLENEVCVAQTENLDKSESVSGSSGNGSDVFFLNGRHHELPSMKVTSKGKTYPLGSGTSVKIPAFTDSSTDKNEEALFEIHITTTYPIYVYYDRTSKENSPWWARQKRYTEDIWDETSFIFEQRWSVILSYLKPRNTTFEFRSNVPPFFGSSVFCFYNETDDSVYLFNSPNIPISRADVFNQLRKGKDGATNNCDAYLFYRNRNNAKTGVPDRLYGCSFQDGKPGDLSLATLEINTVPVDGLTVANETCILPCENNQNCPRSKLQAYANRPWSNQGYCTSGVNDGSSRPKVYFTPTYVSLPQGAKRIPEIYYKLEDVRLEKMINLDPIEEYHHVGSIVTVRCNISKAFTATPFRFALKYKGTEKLELLPVEETDVYSYELWSRSISYAIALERIDLEEIFCFAPLLGSFGWINASLPIQVTEPMPPSFLHEPNLDSEEIPATRVSTFSVQRTFALGSMNKALTCYATGDPAPEITWTWNRVKVSESKGDQESYNVTWSQVLFSQIYKTNEGEYICTATNDQGEAHAAFNVIVAEDSSSLALWISLPVVALVLIAIVAVTVFIMKQKLKGKVLTEQEYQEFLYGNVTENNSNPNPDIYSKAFDPQFIIDRSNLVFDVDSVLGSGEYGVVTKGWLKNGKDGKTAVAVKTTKKNVDIMYVKALISEVKIMAYVGDHRNVVGFLGACIENLMQGKLFVAVEFCDNGDLLGCLRKEKALVIKSVTYTDETNSAYKQNDANTQLSYDLPPSLLIKLVQWSHDIASGMEFIGAKKVIHGDLAARNVLLNGDNVAKISDFGLSRQLLQDYTVYKKKTAVPLPWKWMAVESLTSSNFSVKSDTWAFGITLWEIFSLGDSPYPGCNYDEEFVHKLATGICPSMPMFASDDWYEIMRSCWNVNPELRPEMSAILDRIKEQQINVASRKIAEASKSDYTVVKQ